MTVDDNVGPTWLRVKWHPIADAKPPVLHFIVEYRLSFHSNWTIASQTAALKYNITGLYPNAEYYVRVRGESPKGVGEASQPVAAMTLRGGEWELYKLIKLECLTWDCCDEGCR